MARIIDKMASKANGKIGKKFTVYQRLGQTIIRIRADDYPDAAGGLPADKRGGVGAAEEAERMHHIL